MSSAYALWKTAHIVSSTILFGTGLGTAFFCWFGSRHALRTGEIGALRAILRLTVRADYCFTAPAVVFQLVSGIVLMQLLGWPLVSSWSIAVIALFVLTGACWMPVVVMQMRLSAAASRANSIEELPGEFHRQFRWWLALGVPAFGAVLALFFLMVAKPLALAGS